MTEIIESNYLITSLSFLRAVLILSSNSQLETESVWRQSINKKKERKNSDDLLRETDLHLLIGDSLLEVPVAC